MVEYLTANGHNPDAVLDYSPDKLRMLYEMARRRQVREEAHGDLRFLRLVYLAIGAAMSREGVSEMRRVDGMLQETAYGPKPQDLKANRRAFLDALGHKRKK